MDIRSVTGRMLLLTARGRAGGKTAPENPPLPQRYIAREL
jgi:hypothetical protein